MYLTILRACLNTHQKRRVRARGLQEIAQFGLFCRPGALTGRVFKQALSFSDNRQIQGATAFTGAMGNCQGILDGSIHRQLRDSRPDAEAIEADRDDMKELEAAENKLLHKPEEKA